MNNDTPLTDERTLEFPERLGEWVCSGFTRWLEKENAELHKKHEDALKLMGLVMTQPTNISVALANAEKEKWVQCDQLEELRKDKERLEWLFEHYDPELNRQKIDELMEDLDLKRERERCYREEV